MQAYAPPTRVPQCEKSALYENSELQYNSQYRKRVPGTTRMGHRHPEHRAILLSIPPAARIRISLESSAFRVGGRQTRDTYHSTTANTGSSSSSSSSSNRTSTQDSPHEPRGSPSEACQWLRRAARTKQFLVPPLLFLL
eukprot:254059-Rhodomonas_salina.1